MAFLAAPEYYFIIRPTLFDGLLDYYGIDRHISGYVTWERYVLLLDLAETLRVKLDLHKPADAIEIQSYMWVVSYLIKDGIPQPKLPPPPNLEFELAARKNRAQERERIGLLGERWVYQNEQNRLTELSRDDLAARIRMVSLEDAGLGYDILSFAEDGKELHIEVKTTQRLSSNDSGFWLSQVERDRAEGDPDWHLYRVANIDNSPTFEDLGNIVREQSENWQLKPSTWRVERRVE